MIKSPAFQFYAQDFLTGVMYLTNEEKGIYITMLAKQWTDGKIPKKRLGFLVGYEWEKLSEELRSKFDDKGYYVVNERLEKERKRKENFLEKQSSNGKKGGRPPKSSKKEKPKSNPNQTQKKPLEDEIEVEYEVVDGKENNFYLLLSFLNQSVNQLPLEKANESRVFHNAVYHKLIEAGYKCHYELPIEGGRIDILVKLPDCDVAIELDNRTPRAKNLMKIEGLGYKIISILRNPYKNKSYKQFNVDGWVFYEHNFESKNKTILPWETENFKVQWQHWKVYKKKEFGFKYKSLQSEQAALTQLSNMANGDEKTAIKIIHQSMSNGWKGFFELKKENNGNRSNNHRKSDQELKQSISKKVDAMFPDQ